ncbi:MAG: rRNA maturation RNase YbeY [Actinomycetales bacterium]|nr:rRNA maturation RNase YbeY [Actinomycetales bacterium]
MTIGAVCVTNESGIEIDVAGLARLAAFMIPRLRLHPMCELSVTAVDADRMAELHVAWMDEPGPTDVLSFPMDELRSAPPGAEPKAGVLGDIVLCPDYATAQASQRSRSLDDELAFLVTHGLLHLIGYDHATTKEYDVMFALQDDLRTAWHEQVTLQSLADGMSR